MPDQDTEPKPARRRGGFSMPANPAQALQEMIRQERNTAVDTPSAPEEAGGTGGSAVALPTSSTVAHTTALPEALSTEIPPPSPTEQAALAVLPTETLPVAYTTSSTVGSTTDPIRAAVFQMLQQPLPGDIAKGPHTVTSIKVHQGIWERLGHVAQITGRNKQDLVAEALTDLFAKILREEGQGRG